MENIDIILKHLYRKILIDSNIEHGSIFFAKKVSIDKLYLTDKMISIDSGSNTKLHIEKNISYFTLLYSYNKELIPIIAHTHLLINTYELISFSNQDFKFFNSLKKIGHNKFSLKEFVFILFDGNQYLCQIHNNNLVEEIRGVFVEG